VLKILPDQMQVFKPVADELLAERIVEHLRIAYADTFVHLPSRTLMLDEIAENDLKAMVQTGLAQARSYQITHESALAGFVAVMFEVAPNFDSYPLMQKILQDETTSPNTRLDLLLEQATEEDWEKAKGSYDSAAWNLPVVE
jgi:hypothetical protein